LNITEDDLSDDGIARIKTDLNRMGVDMDVDWSRNNPVFVLKDDEGKPVGFYGVADLDDLKAFYMAAVSLSLQQIRRKAQTLLDSQGETLAIIDKELEPRRRQSDFEKQQEAASQWRHHKLGFIDEEKQRRGE
jgi:hypothetical protein